ncbi:MAG: LSM domain-containing protein [bacterium]
MIEKPLDALNFLRGEDVLVVLKTGKEITGKLVAFDLTTNVTLDINGNHTLIQGNTVTSVSKLAE